MEERILEFIGDLRRAELRISTAEALDALSASAEIGLLDRETFKSTLAATLVKEARDLETFDRIFNLYFLDLEALGEGLKKALGPEDPKVQDQLDQMLDQENLDLDELTELLMRGQGSEMEMAIRGGAQGAGLERLMYFLQVGYFSRRISDQFDWSAIERDIEKIMQALEAKGLDPGQLARIRNYLELRLEAFRRMIRQHVQRELERRAYRAGEQLTREVLSDKPLFALTPDEVAQMKSVVAKLARRIKDALALRQRQEQRGRIDSRKTIRKSLQYGGIPMEVFLKRRHREKPRLITVCDVSDSVRNASRFMLQLVWSLQECFSRVRSYVFVSEIAEVTQGFNNYPVERAIEWALKGAPVDYHCRSDFGYAFSRFANTELDSLDKKTTILMLGDARNNYNDPQAWALRLIRERVKGIIWLNPEGQWGWGIGDSVMPLYAPACDIVRECRTIGQLGEVVDNLVHSWWRRGR
ncbi:MAG TPA: VWA domain-containing protein [Candidatus Binatia bacterium]|nr:VWA domain-containing protein [Candidatus Binatia bacterium]